MSSQYYPNNASVAEIYKSVISDVIQQVREAFLDENVDPDVLHQLKKDWEDKVNSSGCVELEPRTSMHGHQVHPQMRQGPSTIPMRPGQGSIRMASGNQQIQGIIQGHPGHTVGMAIEQGQARQVPVQMQYMQHGQIQLPSQHVQAVSIGGGNVQTINVSGGNIQTGFPQTVRIVQMQAQQGFIPNQQQMMIMPNTSGQQLQQIPTFTLPANVNMSQIRAQQQTMQQHHPHQLDGCSSRELEEEKASDNQKTAKKIEETQGLKKKPSRAEAQKVLTQLLGTLQLDGGGGGMSDSSSEDEEEENDPLRRIADKIGGDGAIEEGETVVEEDPLNSEDDDQDDEDLDTIFDADNIVMCLFEKIHRARNKWKFQLKDGIMNINNRDYCFQKCTGEAEW